MLVIARQPGEVIRIGEDIAVTVGRIDRGKVQLKIEAPREVLILRAELLGRGPAPGEPQTPEDIQ
jgi:carbon storage regulator CsrA